MTTKAADDFEAIRRRLEEIEAEARLALTGSSAPIAEEPKGVESVYGIDYCAFPSFRSATPSEVNEAARHFVSAGTFNLPDVQQFIDCAERKIAHELKSRAHPAWPYAGTGFEWRRFVRS